MFKRADMIKTKQLIEKRIESVTDDAKLWKNIQSKVGLSNYAPYLDFLTGPNRDRVVSEAGIEAMLAAAKENEVFIPSGTFAPKPSDFEVDVALDRDVIDLKNLILEDKSGYKMFDFRNPQGQLESLTNGCSSTSKPIELDEKTAYTLFQKLERMGKLDKEELYHSMIVQMCTNFLYANSERNINDLISETTRLIAIRKQQLLAQFNSSQDMQFVHQRRAWVQYEKNMTLQKIVFITYGIKQGVTFEDLENSQEELRIEQPVPENNERTNNEEANTERANARQANSKKNKTKKANTKKSR